MKSLNGCYKTGYKISNKNQILPGMLMSWYSKIEYEILSIRDGVVTYRDIVRDITNESDHENIFRGYTVEAFK